MEYLCQDLQQFQKRVKGISSGWTVRWGVGLQGEEVGEGKGLLNPRVVIHPSLAGSVPDFVGYPSLPTSW